MKGKGRQKISCKFNRFMAYYPEWLKDLLEAKCDEKKNELNFNKDDKTLRIVKSV